MSLKKVFWISYDLGLKGDYEGLYTFLDSVGAKECGDSIGFFHKDYGDNFLDGLTNDLKKYIRLTKTDRIYVVYLENDTNKAKGKFLFGSRKRSAWEGYATINSTTEEDS